MSDREFRQRLAKLLERQRKEAEAARAQKATGRGEIRKGQEDALCIISVSVLGRIWLLRPRHGRICEPLSYRAAYGWGVFSWYYPKR